MHINKINLHFVFHYFLPLFFCTFDLVRLPASPKSPPVPVINTAISARKHLVTGQAIIRRSMACYNPARKFLPAHMLFVATRFDIFKLLICKKVRIKIRITY